MDPSNQQFTYHIPGSILSPVNRPNELKTPPHSILRNGSNSNNNNKGITLQMSEINNNHPSLNAHEHGLLSPAFSSPQTSFIDSKLSVSNTSTNTSFTNSNSQISLSQSTVKDEEDNKENSEEPLAAPKFDKKRPFSSSSSASASASRKPKRFKGPQMIAVPAPSELPPIVFEASTKPPYSYASLIGMAILRAPERKLTLSQIYQWITDTFSYYSKGEMGWQNSIRHNLSLNKSFEKTEKSRDGKGHFWKIVKGYEYLYFNVQSNKKFTISNTRKSSTSGDAVVATKSKSLTVPPSNPSVKQFAMPDLKRSNTTPLLTPNEVLTMAHTPSDSESFSDDEQTPTISKKKQSTTSTSSIVSTPIPLLVISPRQATDDNINNNNSNSNNNIQSLGTIPELPAPISSWSASASGPHTVFKFPSTPQRNTTTSSNNTATPNYNANILIDGSPMGPLLYPGTSSSTHHRSGSGITGDALPFTSSFSCNESFELSPIRNYETGPLLEPLLTPKRSAYPTSAGGTSTPDLASGIKLTSSSAHSNRNQLSLPAPLPINKYFKTPNNSHLQRTPLQFQLSSMKTQKYWYSPSYLDDFYTSPCKLNNIDISNISSGGSTTLDTTSNPSGLTTSTNTNSISILDGSVSTSTSSMGVSHSASSVMGGAGTSDALFGSPFKKKSTSDGKATSNTTELLKAAASYSADEILGIIKYQPAQDDV